MTDQDKRSQQIAATLFLKERNAFATSVAEESDYFKLANLLTEILTNPVSTKPSKLVVQRMMALNQQCHDWDALVRRNGFNPKISAEIPEIDESVKDRAREMIRASVCFDTLLGRLRQGRLCVNVLKERLKELCRQCFCIKALLRRRKLLKKDWRHQTEIACAIDQQLLELLQEIKEMDEISKSEDSLTALWLGDFGENPLSEKLTPQLVRLAELLHPKEKDCDSIAITA